MIAPRSATAPPKRRMNPRPNEAAARFVYVLVRAETAVKVGVSRNVKRRMSGIQAASPDKVTLFYSERPTAITAFEAEKSAMALLAPWRTSGEWFSCKPELAKTAVRAACSNDDRRKAFFPEWLELERLVRVLHEADVEEQQIRRRTRDPAQRAAALDAEATAREAYFRAWDEVDGRFTEEMQEIEGTWWSVHRIRRGS